MTHPQCERAGSASHATLSDGRLFVCVFGKHTFPEIDLKGVSKKNIVILGHSNIL